MLQDELVAAGIFVRVFNEQPSFVLTHEEATLFCKGLVTWISVYSRKDSFCSPLGKLQPHYYPSLASKL